LSTETAQRILCDRDRSLLSSVGAFVRESLFHRPYPVRR
jgi:hypothetical protein